MLFLLGINVGLHAGDEHYDLRREAPNLPSQLQLKHDSKGVRCLAITEDTTTKTNNGGLKSMNRERNVVWVYPSENQSRCPVHLVDKYVSLLPPVKLNTKKLNFYLHSLEKYSPAQWYREQVVRRNTLRKTISDICKDAKIPGFRTNHSLQRTGTTRLFRVGVDRKLIKEFTMHTSDTVMFIR